MTVTRTHRKGVARRGEPAILFAVGPHSFAIVAADVDEIRELHDLEPFQSPLSSSAIRFTLNRKRNTYYVVDTGTYFRLEQTTPTRVLVLRDHKVAITASAIDRMTEIGAILPLPRAFTGEERRWYRGLTLIDGKVVPVVQPSAFLPDYERELLSRSAARGVHA